VHTRAMVDRVKHRRGITRNMLLAALGALVVSSFSVLGLYLYSYSEPDPSQQLEIALRLLRKGDGETSARIAKSLDPAKLTKRGDISKREFLLGTRERKEAEAVQQRRVATDRNEKAVNHLNRSRKISFPEGYEGQGNFQLGMALFDLFRWEEAEPPLEIAAERWPQGRAEAIDRLVDIDLSHENRDPDAALQRIQRWRSLPRSSADENERTVAKEMQALFVAGDYLGSSKLITRVPVDSPHRPLAELTYGRCLQQLAKASTEPEKTERLKEAAKSFQKILGLTRTVVPIRRQANLEYGRVLSDLGQNTQAVSTFSALRLSSPYEPESLVSGLEEIDCLIDLDRYSDVADTLQHLTKNFGDLRWYQNDWMPISEMRKKTVAAGERLIDKRQFEEAAFFSKWLPPYCDDLDRLRMDSRNYELWALHARQQPVPNQAEKLHRICANAYAALATKLMRSPNYSELMMKAIENYRLSGAFAESNRLLDIYLQFEPRENQPTGLLIKARNYNSLNQSNLALTSLNRILESNTSTSLIYDARLEAARLLAAKDNFQEAEDLIVQNLYYGDLKPESPIWRDSLFELGELLFRRGEKLQTQAADASLAASNSSYENLAIVEQSYNELLRSIERIKDGLRRFDKDPRRLRMLYTTAKAYQLASAWPEMLLKENRIANEDTISGWKSQRKELLNQSRDAYRELRQEITSVADATQLSSNADSFLRNSFFGEADLLFEAEEFEEAKFAYQDAANRFINEPESLEAMVQIAICQKQLGKFSESRITLEMAKDILKRIPTDKDERFKSVTSHERAGWTQYLDWMVSNLPAK
jgi:hypothetical protein